MPTAGHAGVDGRGAGRGGAGDAGRGRRAGQTGGDTRAKGDRAGACCAGEGWAKKGCIGAGGGLEGDGVGARASAVGGAGVGEDGAGAGERSRRRCEAVGGGEGSIGLLELAGEPQDSVPSGGVLGLKIHICGVGSADVLVGAGAEGRLRGVPLVKCDALNRGGSSFLLGFGELGGESAAAV